MITPLSNKHTSSSKNVLTYENIFLSISTRRVTISPRRVTYLAAATYYLAVVSYHFAATSLLFLCRCTVLLANKRTVTLVNTSLEDVFIGKGRNHIHAAVRVNGFRKQVCLPPWLLYKPDCVLEKSPFYDLYSSENSWKKNRIVQANDQWINCWSNVLGYLHKINQETLLSSIEFSEEMAFNIHRALRCYRFNICGFTNPR